MDPAFASEVRGYMSVTDRSGHLCPVLSSCGGDGYLAHSLSCLNTIYTYLRSLARNYLREGRALATLPYHSERREDLKHIYSSLAMYLL